VIDGVPTSTFGTDFAVVNWRSEFSMTTKNTNRTRRGFIKFATIVKGLFGSCALNYSKVLPIKADYCYSSEFC